MLNNISAKTIANGKGGAQKRISQKDPTRREPVAGGRFPQVEGKTLEFVELWLDDDEENYIELRFPDQTALVFMVRPYTGVNVSADYGRWKMGNWLAMKTWPETTARKRSGG